MKTKELIEKLQEMPEDAEVFIYAPMAEEQDDVNRVHKIDTTNQGHIPYVKADYTMRFERQMEEGKTIVLIS